MSNPRLETERGVFYCATCGVLGVNEQGHVIGTPFECPNNSNHFAEVVKSPAGEFWLRVEQRIWKSQEFSPLALFRFEGRAGYYKFYYPKAVQTYGDGINDKHTISGSYAADNCGVPCLGYKATY